jgi:hypothetical protein
MLLDWSWSQNGGSRVQSGSGYLQQLKLAGRRTYKPTKIEKN